MRPVQTSSPVHSALLSFLQEMRAASWGKLVLVGSGSPGLHLGSCLPEGQLPVSGLGSALGKHVAADFVAC